MDIVKELHLPVCIHSVYAREYTKYSLHRLTHLYFFSPFFHEGFPHRYTLHFTERFKVRISDLESEILGFYPQHERTMREDCSNLGKIYGIKSDLECFSIGRIEKERAT